MEKNANPKQSTEWIKIYPSYLDKTIKKSEGRKMGSEFCVENPMIRELYVICKSFNLEVVAEDVI
jgi:signal recognition particle subunit SEC65